MKDLLDYVKLRLEDEPEQLKKASELLEYLYFVHIKPFYKSVRNSEEYKIALDLIVLKESIKKSRISENKIGTQFVKSLVAQYGIKDSLSMEDKQTIESNIILEYHYYITASFIADLLNKQIRNEFFKWFVTIVITIFATIGSFGWFFSGSCP